MAPPLSAEGAMGAPQAPGYFFLTLDKTYFTRKQIYINSSFISVALVTRGAPDYPMGPCTHPRTPGFLGPLVAQGAPGRLGGASRLGAPGHLGFWSPGPLPPGRLKERLSPAAA